MAYLRFTPKTEEDLEDIATYTLDMWGSAQADRYLRELHASCHRLAKNPLLGRKHSVAGAILRRLEQGKHVIFYQEQVTGVLFVYVFAYANASAGSDFYSLMDECLRAPGRLQ